MASQVNSPNSKGNLMPLFLKLFQRFEEEVTLMNTFYEVSITLISKPKTSQKKENSRATSLMNIDAEFSPKILAN